MVVVGSEDLEDLNIDGSIISKWFFKKSVRRGGVGLIGLKMRTNGGVL